LVSISVGTKLLLFEAKPSQASLRRLAETSGTALIALVVKAHAGSGRETLGAARPFADNYGSRSGTTPMPLPGGTSEDGLAQSTDRK
jgi:hypothetical protein